MALRIHDPDNVALRRAVRASVALPVALALALYIVDDPMGAGFTLFGVTGLLINSDFAGSATRRTGAYLMTGVAGSAALLIGWAASSTTVTAVVVTMIVAFGLTFLSVFRGSVSIALSAMLLVFTLAVCLGGPAASLPHYLLGWWIAVAVSTLTALLILPRRRRGSQRPPLAEAFSAGARAAHAAWVGQRDEAALTNYVKEFDGAIDRLHQDDGNLPTRASGIRQRDSTLNALAHVMTSIRLLVDEAHETEPLGQVRDFTEREVLALAIVDALDQLSMAMLDPTLVLSAKELDTARERLKDGVDAWVVSAAQADVTPDRISQEIASLHQLRIFALSVEQMIEMARVANGGEVEDLDVQPPIPQRSLRRILGAQWNWQAPWLRNAIRSAVGLGLGVLVLNLTGVGHGFWVLLGVISVLRYDSSGTRRFAVRAIVGTVIGVMIGVLLITTVGSNPAVLWILLPILTFIGAWAAGAVGYAYGQMAFSAMVLVALGLLTWPPRTADGIVRIEDMAIGAAVALVVGFMFWPRGAAGYLRSRIADSLRSSRDYLGAAMQAFGSTTLTPDVETRHRNAIEDVYRASETYNVAMVQRGPVDDLQVWDPSISLSYLGTSVARIMASFASEDPIVSTHPTLGPAVARARTASDEQWTGLANLVDPAVDTTGVRLPAMPQLPYPTLTPIATLQDAHALVIAVWLTDWVTHLSSLTHLVAPDPSHAVPEHR